MAVTGNIAGLGPADAKVKLAPGADFTSAKLSVQEGFVLSRIDGATSIANICLVTGLPDTLTIEILKRLYNLGLISVGDKPPLRPTAAAPAPSPSPETKKSSPGQSSPSASSPSSSSPSTPAKELAPLPPLIAAEIEVKLADDDPALEIKIEARRAIRTFHRRLESLNYFELIGVSSDVDSKALRRAYFARSKEFHPDRYFQKKIGPYKEMIGEIFKQINAAYKVLENEPQREAYRHMVMAEDAQVKLARQVEANGVEILQKEKVEISLPMDDGHEYSFVSSHGAAKTSIKESPSRSMAARTAAPPSGAFERPSLDDFAALTTPAPTMTQEPKKKKPTDQAQTTAAKVQPENRRSPSSPSLPVVDPAIKRRPSGSTRPITLADIAMSQTSSAAGTGRMHTGQVRRLSPSSAMPPLSAGAKSAATNRCAVQTNSTPTVSSRVTPSRDGPDAQGPKSKETPSQSGVPKVVSPALSRIQKAQEFYVQGVQQLSSGQILAAAASLKLALSLVPDNPEYKRVCEEAESKSRTMTADNSFKRALFEESVGRHDQALSLFIRAAELSPTSQHLQKAAELTLAAGDLIKAKDYATKAVQTDEKNQDAHITLARVYIVAGLYKNARRELQESLKLDSDNQEAKELLKDLKRNHPND